MSPDLSALVEAGHGGAAVVVMLRDCFEVADKIGWSRVTVEAVLAAARRWREAREALGAVDDDVPEALAAIRKAGKAEGRASLLCDVIEADARWCAAQRGPASLTLRSMAFGLRLHLTDAVKRAA